MFEVVHRVYERKREVPGTPQAPPMRLNGEHSEEMRDFKCLPPAVSAGERLDGGVKHRLDEDAKRMKR